jgi:hypothetical protein
VGGEAAAADPVEIRCPSRIHGIVRDGELEVKCKSSHCGAGKGVVVLHYFDLLTGEATRTRTFREPSALFDKKEAAAPCQH